MSRLTLTQPIELVPFTPLDRFEVSPDSFAFDTPTVFKLNDLYMYGNVKLLSSERFTVSVPSLMVHTRQDILDLHIPIAVEVLKGKTYVTAIYSELHDHAAILPLRWGAPRIVVLTSGFIQALGPKLDQELTPLSRRWRYEFDPLSDLVVSAFDPEDDGKASPKRIEQTEEIVQTIATSSSMSLLTGTVQLFPSYTQ